MFGKLIDGKLMVCPKNGYLSDGTPVSNLDRLIETNEEVRQSEGYKPVIEGDRPELAENEYLEAVYTEDEDAIYLNWGVKVYEL